MERSNSASCSGVSSKLPSSSLARTTFLEGDTFKNYLSAHHFSACHFHVNKDTPIRVALRRDAQRNKLTGRERTARQRRRRAVRLSEWLGVSFKIAAYWLQVRHGYYNTSDD
jgi:hypothetical protein